MNFEKRFFSKLHLINNQNDGCILNYFFAKRIDKLKWVIYNIQFVSTNSYNICIYYWSARICFKMFVFPLFKCFVIKKISIYAQRPAIWISIQIILYLLFIEEFVQIHNNKPFPITIQRHLVKNLLTNCTCFAKPNKERKIIRETYQKKAHFGMRNSCSISAIHLQFDTQYARSACSFNQTASSSPFYGVFFFCLFQYPIVFTVNKWNTLKAVGTAICIGLWIYHLQKCKT